MGPWWCLFKHKNTICTKSIRFFRGETNIQKNKQMSCHKKLNAILKFRLQTGNGEVIIYILHICSAFIVLPFSRDPSRKYSHCGPISPTKELRFLHIISKLHLTNNIFSLMATYGQCFPKVHPLEGKQHLLQEQQIYFFVKKRWMEITFNVSLPFCWVTLSNIQITS